MLLDNPATYLPPPSPCTLSCPASVSGSRLSSSVSARAFNNTLFYLAALFTFLMKLFSTIYNCHEQSTGSTCLACPALAGTGLALAGPRLRLPKCTPGRVLRPANLCIWIIRYVCRPASSSIYDGPGLFFSCLPWPDQNLAARLLPAGWLAMASTWFWLLIRVQPPRSLLCPYCDCCSHDACCAKQLAVSRSLI